MFYECAIFFIMAFIISFLATPISRVISFKLGAVDVPKDGRRMHKKPIARLGGLAIVTGFLVTVIINIAGTFFGMSGMTFNKNIIGLIISILIIIGIGILDDIRPLNAKIKFLVQVVATLVVMLVADIRIMNITNPFATTGVSELNIYLSYPLTVLWIVGVTNAINLIDGLDGLAAGVSSISYLSLFFISMITGDPAIAMLAAILAGSTLGFLPYNFNPAKIFMGDTGSTFLGFTLAVISIEGTLKAYTAISVAIPLLVLGIPLFDTTSSIIRRLLNGRPIMEADRGHLHHKLIDMGLSHRQSVALMYVASAALGLCGIVLADKGVLSAIILVIAVTVFVIAGGKYMGEFGNYEKEDASKEAHGSNCLGENILLNKIEQADNLD